MNVSVAVITATAAENRRSASAQRPAGNSGPLRRTRPPPPHSQRPKRTSAGRSSETRPLRDAPPPSPPPPPGRAALRPQPRWHRAPPPRPPCPLPRWPPRAADWRAARGRGQRPHPGTLRAPPAGRESGAERLLTTWRPLAPPREEEAEGEAAAGGGRRLIHREPGSLPASPCPFLPPPGGRLAPSPAPCPSSGGKVRAGGDGRAANGRAGPGRRLSRPRPGPRAELRERPGSARAARPGRSAAAARGSPRCGSAIPGAVGRSAAGRLGDFARRCADAALRPKLRRKEEPRRAEVRTKATEISAGGFPWVAARVEV